MLFVASSELGSVTTIDLDTLATRTLPVHVPSAGALTCGRDGRVYVARTGEYGDARAIVSFKADGSDLRTELDFRRLPILGGAPDGLGFGPGRELYFNTTPLGGPHTGVWKFRPPGGPPRQVILPFAVAGADVGFLVRPPFAGHLVAMDVDGNVVRRPPPFDSARSAVDFVTGLSGSLTGI